MLDKKTKQKIEKIVKDFLDDGASVRGEENIQTHYTIPLLKALGWSSSSIRVNEAQLVQTGKFPDVLLLNQSGATLFVIESKATSLSDGLDGAYTKAGQKLSFVDQLCGYCNAEGVYWGALTNFVEWRVYAAYPKCIYGKKMNICDLDKGISTLTDDVWDFFELLSSSFLQQKNGKISSEQVYYPPKEVIRKDFFEKLKEWRKQLRDYLMKKTNIQDVFEANFETQKVLDRLIFMKVCFDWSILPQNFLSAILYSKKRAKYEELKDKFKLLNEKFDSSLFLHDVCDETTVSDEIVENIVRGLNGIDFSELSVHVIGEVYEDYLGELLKSESSTASENAQKKSQGIYYTPEYIVDFIIKSTVGELLSKVSSIDELRKVRVLDPACGSGSFLIRAFDEFYNKYNELYKNVHNRPSDFEIKKEILLNNLYGVDLDERALQIAQLNLLLKALKNTKEISGRKLLPDLSLNIRCGNSLIFGDTQNLNKKFANELKELRNLKKGFKNEIEDRSKAYYWKKIANLEAKIEKDVNSSLGEESDELKKKKPFNYELKFCEVFEDGGFDLVVGNPPYVQLQKLARTQMQKDLASQNFKTFTLNGDLYCLFYERGIQLLKEKGLLSYITSNKWIRSGYGEKLRAYFLEHTNPRKLLDFGGFKIFDGATVDTNILITQKSVNVHELWAVHFKNDYKIGDDLGNYVAKNGTIFAHFNSSPWFIGSPAEIALKKKIEKMGKPLKDWDMLMHRGVTTGCNEAFIIDEKMRNELIKKDPGSVDIIKPVLRGRDINRYGYEWNGLYLITTFPSLHININSYPAVREYLKSFGKKLEQTGEKGCRKKTDHKWFEIQDNIAYWKEFEEEKVVWLELVDDGRFCVVPAGYYINNSSYMMVTQRNKYFCAVLNSRLINMYFDNICAESGAGTNRWIQQYTELLPIPMLYTPVRKIIADKIEFLVDQIIKTGSETKNLENQIDELVYELYGLSQKEIEIVEGKKDAESEYLKFMTEFKKLDSQKAKIKFIKSKSDEELDLIFEGLDKYRNSHTLSKAEQDLLSEFNTSIKLRPPSLQDKHSA